MNSVLFPCLTNLSKTDVHEACPWEFDAKPFSTADANAYKSWRKQPNTEHLFYSGIVGQASTLRVSESNPPLEIRALVADYDSKIGDEEIDVGLARIEKYYQPTYIHRTPLSGGLRLIWMLERPLMLANYDVAKRFLKAAMKYTHAKIAYPNLDEPAFENPNLYYDVGHSWQGAGGDFIPWVDACGWLVKVSEKAKWTGETIPMETLAAEVQEKFPGRWQGEFVEGARGCRFWDPTADNPTAAVIRPTGMQCFTGTEPFVPWSAIFGRGFVEKVSARKIGQILEGVYYDSSDYWFQSPSGKWEKHAEREMARHLKVHNGLSADRIEGRTYSEVEEALHAICTNCRIGGVAPFIFQPSGVIDFMGEKILNICNVKVLTPAEESGEWGEHFPWLGNFLKELFDPEDQLEYMLAWLKRFYCSARDGRLLQGQAVFLAGDTGRGKTFFSNRIVGALVGGHADASQYLMGKTNFNKDLFHKAFWTVDDALPGDNNQDHKAFSTMIKRVTANNMFEFHAKFRDACQVAWSGRVMVTGNLDADSLRILPDLDTSILDKLLLFKAAPRVSHFPEKHELEDIVRRELPHFAAWLISYQPPEHVLDKDPRYGVSRYHHPFLKQAAGESQDASTVRELIQIFMRDMEKDFEGTTVELIQVMLIEDKMKVVLGNPSSNRARWMSIQLGKLEAKGDGFVKTIDYRNRNKVWRIKKTV
jgi:Family of unknown function (DUF5906)